MMLDCGLNMQSILHFMPLPMVPSSKFNSLPTWFPRDNQQDWQVEGVSIQSEERVWCLQYILLKNLSFKLFQIVILKILQFKKISLIYSYLFKKKELKECCGRVFVDSVPEFSPPLEKIIDFSEIDAILISNYTCMLALPFITEGTGFKGIYY